jgi:hypothetical protein
MGGAVAFQLAIDRPELVGQLVWFGGASFDPGGIARPFRARPTRACSTGWSGSPP